MWKSNVGTVKKLARRKAAELVTQAAFDVEAGAKELAPVRTGYLRNSIQAQQVNELSAVVEVGAEYGIHVELGGRSRAPRPFLLPALERVVQALGAKVQRWF